MYTLSLDEFGKFEENDNEPKGIGGIIYDDGDFEFESNNEVKRIRAFYSEMIRRAKEELGEDGESLTYPMGLHHNTKVPINIQKIQEKTVKTWISKYLSEFMQNGTVDGKLVKGANGVLPERKGKYFIYCILKSDTGKTQRLNEESKALQNDEEGFNLYFHMADEVIGRTVFHNPVVPYKAEFNLQLATRISPIYARKRETTTKFRIWEAKSSFQNGKDVVMKDGTEGLYYNIGSLDVYRTVISKYIAEDNPNKINILDLCVRSIDYSGRDKKAPYEFMYLADSLCSELSFELINKNRTDSVSWINEIDGRCSKLLPKERLLIFGYDDIDIVFSEALTLFQNGKYYDALKICHDARNHNGCFVKYYRKNWFPYIINMIIESNDINSIEKAIHELYMSQMSNIYEQDRGIYILDVLEKAVSKLKEKDKALRGESIAELYQCGVITYCHIGDYENAEKYLKKSEDYVVYMKIEDYVRMKHLLCVCYTDGFNWDKALKCSEEILENENALVLVKYVITGKDNAAYYGVAKANSTKGQIYSYCKDNHAEEYFNIALNYYEKGSPNYLITLSYLLHHYIDMGEKEKYIEKSLEYFGGVFNPEERLDYILNEGLKERPIFNLKFALYVFVKGLYIFEKDKVNTRLRTRLENIEGYVNKKYKKYLTKRTLWTLTGHPSELIFKYIALLAADKCESQENLDCITMRIKGCLHNKMDLLECIQLMSLAEIEDIQGNTKSRNEIIKRVAEILKNGFFVFRKIDTNEKAGKLYEVLKNYFTYMYC